VARRPEFTEGESKYGCVACHADNGVGIGDVTKAKMDFLAGSSLQAWSRNPSAFRPMTKMPGYQGA
jgi:hypothetical protein